MADADQHAAMDEMWNAIDKTNQGFLNKDEAKLFIDTTLRELGIPGNLTDDGLVTILNEVDNDGSGRFSKTQLIEFFSNFMYFFADASIAAAVQIVAFSFVPSQVTLCKGGSVTWTHANPLAQLHTINSENGEVESPQLQYGQQFSQTFPTPGTYRCYCHVHSFMTTVVTVVDVAHEISQELAKEAHDESVSLSRSAARDAHRMSTHDAFVHAASLDQTTVVQRWIDKGHDINHADSDGQRALCVAAQNQCMDTMALLVKHGANIHAKQKGGQTALHAACTWGRRRAVQMLLRLGSEVDASDDNGQVPLHCACQHGDPALVKLLLEYKADPYIEDEVLYPLDETRATDDVNVVAPSNPQGRCKRLEAVGCAARTGRVLLHDLPCVHGRALEFHAGRAPPRTSNRHREGNLRLLGI
ncbi:hypothetical protein H310_00974, partial [Aphanomyces invadans]